MNLVLASLLKRIFKKRDNLLGTYGFVGAVAFLTIYFFTLQISFLLYCFACSILSFMGGLEIKFDEKTERQIKAFDEGFKPKRY